MVSIVSRRCNTARAESFSFFKAEKYFYIYGIFPGGSKTETIDRKKHFHEFAEQWFIWWSPNWKKYLANEPEAQLKATKKSLDDYSKSISK